MVDAGRSWGAGGPCDLCGESWGREMHEIISRGRTLHNEAAREASYDKHICSILCSSCHTGLNLAESHEADLLAFNMGLYGREAVLAAIKVVADLLNTPLILDIPEEGTL